MFPSCLVLQSKILCISSRESPFIGIKKYTWPLLPSPSPGHSDPEHHQQEKNKRTTPHYIHPYIWYNFMGIQIIIHINLPCPRTHRPSIGTCDSECTQVVIKYSYVWPISIQGLGFCHSQQSVNVFSRLVRVVVSLAGCSQMEMCTIPCLLPSASFVELLRPTNRVAAS